MAAEVPVSYRRTNASELNDVPIVDGQIVVSTAASAANVYFDVDESRLPLASEGAVAYDGVLTIQENGTDVATFSANQQSNATANITVPRSLSELDGDSTHRVVTDTEKATWNSKTSNTGTVTSVATGAGLTGGTITGSGTIKAKLQSETQSSLTAVTKGSTSGREYAVGLDASGNLSVNVPWVDTNTDTNTHTIGWGTCSTAAATATKAVTISTPNFVISTGSVIAVTFSYTNTASYPSLAVTDSTGTTKSSPMLLPSGESINGSTPNAATWSAGDVIMFVWNGNSWVMPEWPQHLYIPATVTTSTTAPTTVTFSNYLINTTSEITLYTSIYGLYPTDITVTGDDNCRVVLPQDSEARSVSLRLHVKG